MPARATAPPCAGHHGRSRQAKLPERLCLRRWRGRDQPAQAFCAVGHLRQRQWFAWLEQLGRRFCVCDSRRPLPAEVTKPAKQPGIVIRRNRLHSVDPGENLLIRDFEPALEFAEFGIAQGRQLRVGEAPEHQIHLANAAMPAAKQQTASAVIQTLARHVRPSGHRMISNAKNPDGAGRGLYKGAGGPMSAALCTDPHCAGIRAQASMAPMRPQVLNPLFGSLTSLPGVGPKLEKLYARLFDREAPRVVDLLFHLPSGVIDRRARPKLRDVQPGQVVTVAVTIGKHRPGPPRRSRAPYRVYASDDTGDLTLTYFNPNRDYLEKLLPEGETRYVSGTAEFYDGMLQMVHPDRVVDEAGFAALPLVEPVYPLTEGLALGNVRRAMDGALGRLPDLPEWQDEAWVARERFPAFSAALRHLHRPAEPHDILPETPAWTRLAYDELLAGQLALALVRAHMRRQSGRGTASEGRLRARILKALPYALTHSQQKAVDDIITDLARPQRMLRLLQGDVGSGKTVVALNSGRSCDRGWPAGRFNGADGNSRPPASRHHRPAGGSRRHSRRNSHRPRAWPGT